MRRLIAAALGFAVLVFAAEPASAEKRVALVIGNAAYKEAAPLANPANDARAVVDSLRRLSFDVVEGVDLDVEQMRQVIRQFSRKLEGSDVALFFYAGHGMQVYGKNYLVPVDAKLTAEADLDFAAVDADLVLKQMERQPRVKLVILDACRDNPLAKTLARSMGKTRSAEALAPGLAKINSGAGTLIAFATEPGAVALDGEDQNSPFTRSLLKHIETPGAEIQVVMTRVRGEVFKSTQEQQLPWVNTSLTGEFYLVPKAPEAIAEPAGQGSDKPVEIVRSTFDEREIELALWRSAEATQDSEAYREYVRQYPQGRFANMARLKIERLEKSREEAGAQGQLQASAPQPPAEQHLERSLVVSAEGDDPSLGLTQARRSDIQQRLTAIGFATGGSDGVFGPRTRKAIAAWQDSRKVASTGYLTHGDYDLLVRDSQAALDRQRAQAAARRAAEQQNRQANAAPVQTVPDPYAPSRYQPAPSGTHLSSPHGQQQQQPQSDLGTALGVGLGIGLGAGISRVFGR